MPHQAGSRDLSVAVVTGCHPYDVRGFQRLFRSVPGADCYFQHLEDFVHGADRAREWDVVLFYMMPEPEPPRSSGGWEGRIGSVLESLGTSDQGIFLLHHAILTYWDWPFWSDIVGIRQRRLWGDHGYHHGQDIHVQIADPDHPITRGLAPWSLVDETYEMDEPAADSQVLLTTDHPQSMQALGWVRTFGQSRVFCLELGHDDQAYANAELREVVRRGIEWCGRRI
jgi:uncharacterized protein